MKTIDKIDEFLKKLDSEIDPRIIEAKGVGGPEYDAFYKKMLAKWKIKSYKDLPKDQQTKFFDDVDKKWNSQKKKGD